MKDTTYMMMKYEIIMQWKVYASKTWMDIYYTNYNRLQMLILTQYVTAHQIIWEGRQYLMINLGAECFKAKKSSATTYRRPVWRPWSLKVLRAVFNGAKSQLLSSSNSIHETTFLFLFSFTLHSSLNPDQILRYLRRCKGKNGHQLNFHGKLDLNTSRE